MGHRTKNRHALAGAESDSVLDAQLNVRISELHLVLNIQIFLRNSKYNYVKSESIAKKFDLEMEN